MATYVKGAQQYTPDIKPFTPDYKFLSAVLETRQDKYDTNFKATNDLYNKVVYADLSREDTKERRDQYADQIGPHIEKISGMDLSLAQNVNAAKSVFAPFYDDDLTVKDIVYTSNYKDQMKHAERMRNSPSEDMYDRYWDIGVQGLNYRMDDFVNASEERALNMGVPKYVDDVKLFDLATSVLEEMDPNLSMKMDSPGPNGNFIITEKNGRLITGAALQTLESALLNDPRVQRAYAERSFVQSRTFADNMIKQGTFSTVEQGQQEWANTTIKRVTAINDKRLEETGQQLTTLENANVNWANYKANNGIIEGSDDDNVMKENLSAAEATQLALDKLKGIQQQGGNSPSTVEGSLNQAYSMLMNHNIMSDLTKAARSYSQRDQEYTIRESKFALNDQQYQYDLSKIKANQINFLTRQENEYRLKTDLARKEGKLVNEFGENDPLLEILQGNRTTKGSSNTIDVPVNEDGEVSQNADMIERTADQFLEKDNALAINQVDKITRALKLLYPTGTDATPEKMGTGLYEIEIPNNTGGTDKFTANSLDELSSLLLDPQIKGEGENAQMVGYTNREQINSIYGYVSQGFTNTADVTKLNPSLTLGSDQRTQYDELYNEIAGLNGTNTQVNALNTFITNVHDNYAEVYESTRGNVIDGDNENIKSIYQAGFPDIMGPNKTVLTKDQYLEKVVEGINAGTITNPNLNWEIDAGTNNSDYKIQEVESVPNPNYTGSNYSPSTMQTPAYNTDGTPKMIIDMSAVKDEAGMLYDALYTNLNDALSGKTGDFEVRDLDSEIYGYTGDFSDVVSNQSFERNFNPMVPNELANKEVFQMINQINTLDKEGTPYGIISGDIDAYETNEEILNIKSELGVKVFNMWKNDAALWLSNKRPAVSTGQKAPAAKIIYTPVIGLSVDGQKTLAGYQVIFSPDWLASKRVGTNTSNASEVGSLKESEILELQGNISNEDSDIATGQGGITILFDQGIDINSKADKNTYYSFVQADLAKKGYADYTVADGNKPTGTYRIVQEKGGYYVYSKTHTYQQGGKYTVEENTVQVDMAQGLEGLDKQVVAWQQKLFNLRERNRLAKEKDVSVNGNK
jgi:hypothetical protein|tara:strand:+ start:1848 stop:5111 length:3264 start_codon:yes stop_codon:yes gene_type:complete